MYLLSVFLPFISYLSLSLGLYIDYKNEKKNVSNQTKLSYFAFYNILLSFFISSYGIISYTLKEQIVIYTFYPWLSIGSEYLSWIFIFDILTLIMIWVVTLVSSLVHLFSFSYMREDPNKIRFYSYLSLFTFFMLILVTSGNFLQLFLGWEGIGLCSYLLIGFWFTRVQANKSALKAIILNRFGDVSLLIAISSIFYFSNSLNFFTVFSSINFLVDKSFWLFFGEINVIDFISFWLVMAAAGKSAQIGLHIWLPDAMEGPTPVSALIHAATMVTAGIFLIIRCSFIIEHSDSILLLVLVLGGLTAFFSSTIGLVQNDIKKIIAYSTCSQLGYMFFVCGLSNYYGSIFHLANHAIFKALLFLSAGSIIHILSNEQDVRKMGNYVLFTPFTYLNILIGSLALTGFPFLSGFYSKDFVIETSLLFLNFKFSFSFFLSVLTAIFTLLYSIRLLYVVFIVSNSSFKNIFKKTQDHDMHTIFVLGTLGFLSIIFGYLSKDICIGPGTFLWYSSIYLKFSSFYNIIDIDNFLVYKTLPLIFIFSSCFFFSIVIYNLKSLKFNFYNEKSYLFNFLSNKWYFDYLSNILAKNLYTYCYTLYLTTDKGFLEIFKPIFFSELIYKLNKKITLLQFYNIHFYLFVALVSTIFLLYFLIFFLFF